MTPGEIQARAVKAKAILDSPIYEEAYANVRMAILTAIEKAPMADTAQCEDLRKCLRLLRDVRANFELAVKQGQVIDFQLAEELERRKNPLRGIFKNGRR